MKINFNLEPIISTIKFYNSNIREKYYQIKKKRVVNCDHTFVKVSMSWDLLINKNAHKNRSFDQRLLTSFGFGFSAVWRTVLKRGRYWCCLFEDKKIKNKI